MSSMEQHAKNILNKLRKKRHSVPNRELDAESAALWKELRADDLQICCKAARIIYQRGITTMSYQFYKKDDIVKQVDIVIGYCCGCGRKL